jgi:hypothetical protein
VFAGAPREPRGMGQPPTATRHRVTGGGEPCPQGADDYRTITAQLPAFLAGRPGTMGRTGGRRWSGARSRPTSGADPRPQRAASACTRCGDTTVVGVLVQRAQGSVRVAVCPRSGSPRRILGAVTEPRAVRRLLAALGLAPSCRRARRPRRLIRRRSRAHPATAGLVCPFPRGKLPGPARADLRPPLPDPARARYGSRSGPRGGPRCRGAGHGARLTQGSPRDVLGVPTFGQVNSPGGRL